MLAYGRVAAYGPARQLPLLCVQCWRPTMATHHYSSYRPCKDKLKIYNRNTFALLFLIFFDFFIL